MQRKIIDFYRNKQDHWVASLECGHAQTIRHNPPWINRRWVLREETRQQRIGRTLNCRLCDEGENPAPPPEPHADPAAGRAREDKPRPAVRYLRGRTGRRGGTTSVTGDNPSRDPSNRRR